MTKLPARIGTRQQVSGAWMNSSATSHRFGAHKHTRVTDCPLCSCERAAFGDIAAHRRGAHRGMHVDSCPLCSGDRQAVGQ